MARRFELHRDTDVSGVSGTGVVAEGIEFSGGCVALRWLSEWPTSVVFHDKGIEAVKAVHGHDGKTRIVWLEADHGGWDAAEKANARADKQSRLAEELQAEIDRLRAQQPPSAPDVPDTSGSDTAAAATRLVKSLHEGGYLNIPDDQHIPPDYLQHLVTRLCRSVQRRNEAGRSSEFDARRWAMGLLVQKLCSYQNADGSVTLTPSEYVRLRTEAEDLLGDDLRDLLPWRVHYAGRGDEVVGAFADRLAAEAFVQLTRKRGGMAISGPEGHPPTRDAFKPKTASVATMPVPASREDQPAHDRKTREALADIMRQQTLLAQLRGMQYVVVDTSADIDSPDYCRAAFKLEPAARDWAAAMPVSTRASLKIFHIDELLKKLEEAAKK